MAVRPPRLPHPRPAGEAFPQNTRWCRGLSAAVCNPHPPPRRVPRQGSSGSRRQAATARRDQVRDGRTARGHVCVSVPFARGGDLVEERASVSVEATDLGPWQPGGDCSSLGAVRKPSLLLLPRSYWAADSVPGGLEGLSSMCLAFFSFSFSLLLWFAKCRPHTEASCESRSPHARRSVKSSRQC